MVTDTIIRKGYKQTEIGVIPEDWNAEKLGDLTTKVGSGITPTGGEKVYKIEGRPFLRSQNIGWGDLSLDEIVFIDEETHNTFSSTEIKEGDVFLNITGASIGRSAVADKRVAKGNVNQHVCIIRTHRKLLNPQYLNAFLLSYLGQRYIASFQAGGNRQGLNFGQIKSIQIIRPPLTEQTAIATVLSQSDALIEHLEKLIAKKKAIKQGAMQQLLTGRKRLSGFTGEWEMKELREIVDFSNGKAHENFISEIENYILVNSKFISTEGRVFKYSNVCFCSVSVGTVLMVMSDVPNGKAIAKCFMVDRDNKYAVNQRICALKSKIDARFLFYKINRNPYYLAFDDGVKQTNLRKDDVLGCKLSIPKEELEQIAIATVLHDMDLEIEKLEIKLEKYKMLKQGMMQQLLTGKIRLL